MDKNLGMENLDAIFHEIQSAEKKWKEIGAGLGLSSETLKRIERDAQGRADRCLYAVIRAWLHHRDRARPTLRSLRRTLQSPKVGEDSLAGEVMTKRGFSRHVRGPVEKKEPLKAVPMPAEVEHDKKANEANEGGGRTPLSEKDLADILTVIRDMAHKWNQVGVYLEFSDGELKAIRSHPFLIAEGVSGYLREMVVQWLKGAHNSPTKEELVDALKKAGEKRTAQDLLESDIGRKRPVRISTEKKEALPAPQLGGGQEDGGEDTRLLSYLKSFYRRKSCHSVTEWPPTQDVEYINLVLVHQDKKPVLSAKLEKMVQLARGGQIQNVLDNAEFQKLDLADITDYDAHRKVIIIEGAPGVGKTTLAQKLCHDWALGQALQEYSLVLYVPLRVPLVRVSESVGDLLKYFGDSCTQADVRCMQQSLGKKVLFVLDGWDELRPSCQDPDMFFPKLIRGELLPECSVLVTSRPGVTAVDIRIHTNRQIEILGFTESQVKQYIHSYFKSSTPCGKSIAIKLIEDLQRYPNVSGTCYVAINLTIVCYVYEVSGYQLPSTLSEVYEEFVFHAVKRHFTRLSGDQPYPQLCSVKTLVDFDGNVTEVLGNLGQLALDGLQENELIFSKDKLQEVCHVDESEVHFDGFGLLKLLHVFRRRGTETFYHFLHLTVQEYLAAYCIAHNMDEDHQSKILAIGLRDVRYEEVLKFFCGIDRFKSRPARVLFSQSNLMGVPSVMECIFEGQWEDGCQKVAKCTGSSFTIKCDLQPYRSLVIGYVMAKSATPWKLKLYKCNVTDRELKSMSQFVLQVPTVLGHLCIEKAFLATNSIKCLAEIVRSQVQLSKLILSEINLNDEALHILYEGLCDHKGLEVLKLTNNDITSSSATIVINLLSHLPALQCLDLIGNRLGEQDCRDILASAFTCTTLTELYLPCASQELSTQAADFNIRRKERGLPGITLNFSSGQE